MLEGIYRDKDGHRRFMNDWDFSYNLMEYVEKTYGENRWAIDSCYQVTPTVYSASFSPYYGYGESNLYIRIVYNEESEIGWDFFPG